MSDGHASLPHFLLHEEVNTCHKVERPALFDKRITDNVVECHCVDIFCGWKIPNAGQLYWRTETSLVQRRQRIRRGYVDYFNLPF